MPNVPPDNELLHHKPHIGARMAHDEFFRRTMIAQALLYVSLHFDEFMTAMSEGLSPDVTDALTDINRQTFDTWIYPEIEAAANQVKQARHDDIGAQFGAIPLDRDQLNAVLNKIMGK